MKTCISKFLCLIILALVGGNSAIASPNCGLYAYKSIVTDVYDGDTITVDVDLGFKMWIRGEKLRLVGIDAPDLRGVERAEGLVARDALRSRILNKEILICTERDKTGKYGRYLATLYDGDENLNAWLIAEGLAKPYDK